MPLSTSPSTPPAPLFQVGDTRPGNGQPARRPGATDRDSDRDSDRNSDRDSDRNSDIGTDTRIVVRAWIDPLVDDHGHDPRSAYVETFWLGVLGPTATWLLRRLATELEAHPDGVDFDLVSTAASMGMSFRSSRSSAFSKALQRCVMFGLAHPLADGGLAVRRRVPAVAHRHLRRLPPELQSLHEEWESEAVTLDDLTRAHRLAMTMLEVGDEPLLVEPQLRALGVGSAVAEQVAENVARLTAG